MIAMGAMCSMRRQAAGCWIARPIERPEQTPLAFEGAPMSE